MTDAPLHTDDPAAFFTRPDGSVIRNLTPAEYDETFNDPGLTVHGPPEHVIQAILDA